jgi:hypothetical protein
MSKIKVYVRTRPTDQFAKDQLFFREDEKVRVFTVGAAPGLFFNQSSGNFFARAVLLRRGSPCIPRATSHLAWCFHEWLRCRLRVCIVQSIHVHVDHKQSLVVNHKQTGAFASQDTTFFRLFCSCFDSSSAASSVLPAPDLFAMIWSACSATSRVEWRLLRSH